MELIYAKVVDKSVLWDGLSIRNKELPEFFRIVGDLDIGEQRTVKLLLGSKLYDGVKIKNEAFNRKTYSDHKPVVQIRYYSQSEFSKALRRIYADVWEYIEEDRALKEFEETNGGKRRNTILPEHLRYKIAFYTTDDPDVWYVDTYGKAEYESLIAAEPQGEG